VIRHGGRVALLRHRRAIQLDAAAFHVAEECAAVAHLVGTRRRWPPVRRRHLVVKSGAAARSAVPFASVTATPTNMRCRFSARA